MTSDHQAPVSSEAPGLKNPFVGPRPFQRGERLYGRSREVRELFYLLTAERIVWLHSPSGAGKTSLIWASLVPRLERDGFTVWPGIRVNLELPREQLGTQADGVNRYLLSAILSLEEGLPEKERRPVESLAQLKFSDYLEGRLKDEEAAESTLLIFDQFEEILTVDPLHVAEKMAFFQEVGEVLRNPNLWALFSLREEFLAQLEPYIDWIPTRWSNTFRLELLGEAAVGEVVKRSAEQGGRTFSDEAAGDLFKDLARIQVQQPDGSFVEEDGRTAEPVQLQVVCSRLWDSRTGEAVTQQLRHHVPGQNHRGMVVGAQFSADGSRILTWGWDGSARLWDSGSGEALIPPMRHGVVRGALFGADGARVLTWGRSGARVWDVSIDADWPVDKVILKTEVETGTVLKPTGELQALSASDWQEKRWCEYDAIRYRLGRMTKDQWRTSQRLCHELTEKAKAGETHKP